jgi:hypothetical protein
VKYYIGFKAKGITFKRVAEEQKNSTVVMAGLGQVKPAYDDHLC